MSKIQISARIKIPNSKLDKKDIILSEIQACERLLKYTRDENDKITLENEILELKLALDLMH